MLNKYNLIFTFLFFLTAGNPTGLLKAGNAEKSDSSFLSPLVSVDQIKRHLYVLAADSLEGRGTGTDGSKMAADYIASELERFGLQKAPGQDSWFQSVPLHGSFPLAESEMKLINEDGEIQLELWRDYILFNTGSQTFIPNPLEMVFVGYGISAPEYDYDDYRNLNVVNKIVVYFSGEPFSDNPSFFEGFRHSIYSDRILKHRIALSRGARGSIMIPHPDDETYSDWEYWVSQYRTEDVQLPFGYSENLNAIFSLETASRMLELAGESLTDIVELNRKDLLRPFIMDLALSFKGQFKERDFVDRNVAAVIEGSDPLLKDSWVAVVAHYDHLGIGPAIESDSIYNGTIDNAIGTATVLELARHIKQSGKSPRRSIIFLFVTGEEKGLLGSRYYCSHPLVPLNKTIAAINVDGIAIIDRFKSIVGIGVEHSTIGNHMISIAADSGLKVLGIPRIFSHKEPLYASDHFSFARAGIPVIQLMEGQDYENIPAKMGIERYVKWGQEIYHTPFDDLNQPINYRAVQQHAGLIKRLIIDISNTFIEPQWLPGSRFINSRLQSMAEER